MVFSSSVYGLVSLKFFTVYIIMNTWISSQQIMYNATFDRHELLDGILGWLLSTLT